MFTKLLGFFGIPSPAVLLGILAALGAVGGWSYHLGDGNGFNRAEAARATAQDQALAPLREELAAARERALAEASARGVATAAADQAKAGLTVALRELRNAKNKPAASCVSDDWRLRVNAAVDSANGPIRASGAGSVPVVVPGTAKTGIGLRFLGGRSPLGVWRVYPPSRDVSQADR